MSVSKTFPSPDLAATVGRVRTLHQPSKRGGAGAGPDSGTHAQCRIAVIQPIAEGLARRGHVVSLHAGVQDAQAEARRRTDILALIAPVGPAVEVGSEVSLSEARRP